MAKKRNAKKRNAKKTTIKRKRTKNKPKNHQHLNLQSVLAGNPDLVEFFRTLGRSRRYVRWPHVAGLKISHRLFAALL